MGLNQAIGSRNQTLDPQKRSCARPGIRTLDRLKRSFARSCTRSRNTIAQTIANAIAHMIIKINVHTDARTRSTWNVLTGRRTTARPTERRPDRSNFLNFQNILRFPRIMKKDAYRTECIFPYTELYQESWRQPRLIDKEHTDNMPYIHRHTKGGHTVNMPTGMPLWKAYHRNGLSCKLHDNC